MIHMRFRIEEWLEDIIDGNFDVVITLKKRGLLDTISGEEVKR